MNVDNINLLIATLEAEVFPDGRVLCFNMGTWIEIESCGTVACMAGTAALLAGMKNWSVPGSVKRAARRWLDISDTEAYQLFLDTGKLLFSEVTRDVAVACLKRFRDTGTVVWLRK